MSKEMLYLGIGATFAVAMMLVGITDASSGVAGIVSVVAPWTTAWVIGWKINDGEWDDTFVAIAAVSWVIYILTIIY